MIDMKKRLFINVTHLGVDKPKQMTGANVLYNTYKGTSYALLDFNSLRKDNTQLQVFTNNKRITERYKSPYEISSDRKNVNVKFRISKYLTALSSESPRNNETTTYIRFSVRQSTWYFGFYLPCSICSQLCAIVLSKDRKVCGVHKKEVIQIPPKVPLEKAIFKEKTHESTKQIYSARSGISYTKQLAFDGRKLYECPSAKCKKPVKYRVIYRDYNEMDLAAGTKKAELFAKRRVKGLKNNMDKWRILNNGEVRTHSRLSHHIWKPIAAIMTEQYIKSSDLALLYSEVNSHSTYNELTEDIFLNHTFDEDDFTMIRAFKEDTLPQRKIATKEDYDMMHHIFTKCNLSVAEAADHRYRCSRDDIVYDMNFIDQWYNESLQAIDKRKEVKRQSRRSNRVIIESSLSKCVWCDKLYLLFIF
ncbi:hypothetical protein RhiirA4_484938 [Rhizophagus irregularis]|uniref:Uncharacterized protein n=1 Tax=Rhizophagus irregularis TaxID=588596 RepID=A0A2I1HPK5_9GLOM|nr:hypothetical protein RhiirA4_484938 [Rhizophagus irregularis]